MAVRRLDDGDCHLQDDDSAADSPTRKVHAHLHLHAWACITHVCYTTSPMCATHESSALISTHQHS